MININLVMPMAGAGSRFKDMGYNMPKPLIMIKGFPFFYWSALSVTKKINIKHLIFIVLNEHCEMYGIDSSIRQYFPDAVVIKIPNIFPGAVYTAMEGIKAINNKYPVIINDCDHMFRCSALEETVIKNNGIKGAGLLTFESDIPRYSYVKYDGERIMGTVEKEVVSNHAICGAYIFQDKNLFLRYSNEYVKDCPYNECFISGVFNLIAKDGIPINEYELDWHVEYGTPEEYEFAMKSKHFEEMLG